MKILVTGAKGFLGTYLVTRLLHEGHNVIEHDHDKGDLTDTRSLERYQDIDLIYHLAARTYVPESWEIPYTYISDNNAMLVNVLELCRKIGSRLVFISTYLYGEPEYLPVDEKHKCVSTTPYHLCKKIGEDICEFYSRNFNINIAVIRPFNVYGKGQNRNFLLPKIYEQVSDLQKKTIDVFNLSPKRDYVYIDDLITVLVRIIPFVEGYDVYNMGAGKSYSVKEAIEIMQSEFGTKKIVLENFSERKNEVMDCVADITHLKNKIGEISITPLADGIHKWHMEDIKSNECSDAEL